VQNVRRVIAHGIIIENYPEDKYGPSCLIFGMTAERRPIHIQRPLHNPTKIVIMMIA